MEQRLDTIAIAAVIKSTMRRLIRTLEEEVSPDLASIINATPSGDRRNTITDINIHVGQATHLLKELLK